MRVLVAGGSGFIGSRLCHELAGEGYKVASFDNDQQYVDVVDEGLAYQIKLFRKELMKGVVKFRDDVRHEGTFLDALNEFEPNTVVNLANLPLANRSHRNPQEAYDGIMKSTFYLLSALSQYRRAKLVHISSSMVYGDFTAQPQPEDVILKPKDIYGCLKAASEDMVHGFSVNKDIPAIIIRPSAVYGFGDLNQRVVQKFVEGAVLGNPLKVNNPGHTRLDFTYVRDLVKGITLAIEGVQRGITDTFNITTGSSRSLRMLINIIRGRFPTVRVDEHYQESYRPTRGTLDISKAREVLGYDPKWKLEAGVDEYISMTEQAVQCLQMERK